MSSEVQFEEATVGRRATLPKLVYQWVCGLVQGRQAAHVDPPVSQRYEWTTALSSVRPAGPTQNGSDAVPLTSLGVGAHSFAPRWSPNGDRITFHSNWEVLMIPAAGAKPRTLVSHSASDGYPSFSQGGQWIYFTSNRTGKHQIWRVPACGGDAVQVTNNGGYAATESPEGAYLYYVQTLDPLSPLWRLPSSGGVPVKFLDAVVLSNFAVLKGGIYYIDRPSAEGGMIDIDRPSGETRLRYFDFATRKSTTVARNLDNVDIGLTASRDGRSILYTRVDSSIDDLMLVDNFR